MNAEDRLRAAIAARTNAVEPSPGGLHEIEERLMEAQRNDNRNRWLLGIASAAAVVALVVAAVALRDDDDAGLDTVATTTTTTAPEETTTTPTTEAPPAQVDASQAIFPDPGTSQRFDDPTALVTAFVKDYVGMTHPVVGVFLQGDSRSGEIDVRGSEQGAPTTVLVRQLEDDTWFVIGAVTDSIQPTEPTNGATVTSPIVLRGQAYAFEGTVGLRLMADGVADPIATGFVTGRGDGVLGSYEGELEYPAQTAAYGVLLYTSESGEDGAPMAFVAHRVRFG